MRMNGENRLLIFGGTTEGRLLAECAAHRKIPCIVSVATEYGESLLSHLDGIRPCAGRKDRNQIAELIRKESISLVIDATHPFAQNATEEIKGACLDTDTEYLRCLRERTETEDEGGGKTVFVKTVAEAADYLKDKEGNVFIATGSKELSLYTCIPKYKERCFARVLSTVHAVEDSVRLGFQGAHLIAMQGPFSEEMNVALLRQTKARWFVTKESGSEGGYLEKQRAARAAGAVLVVVRRPEEEGLSLEEIISNLSYM